MMEDFLKLTKVHSADSLERQTSFDELDVMFHCAVLEKTKEDAEKLRSSIIAVRVSLQEGQVILNVSKVACRPHSIIKTHYNATAILRLVYNCVLF